eukprot:jgi/Tetstr1/454771/TSEL_041654.t1
MEHKRESKPLTTLQLFAGFVNNIHKGETVAAVKNAVIDAGDKDMVSGTSYRTTPLPLAGMVQWLSATANGTEAAISMTMEVDDHPAASSPPSHTADDPSHAGAMDLDDEASRAARIYNMMDEMALPAMGPGQKGLTKR